MNERIPAIDLTRHHFKRDLGDITVFGTWLWREAENRSEPALVLIPRYRLEGIKPCVVALSDAHEYNQDARALVHMARRFAHMLGFADEMTNVRKLATLIHDHLLDLIMMPNDPRRPVVIGEATVDIGGRKQTIELLDHVRIQQA
jgi:hypothetical protein